MALLGPAGMGHLSWRLRSELLEGVVLDNVALVIGYDFVEGDLSFVLSTLPAAIFSHIKLQHSSRFDAPVAR